MEWNHLPLPGGIYAQHPKFVDQIRFIFQAKHEEEKEKRKKDEQKQRSQSRSAGKRGRRR